MVSVFERDRSLLEMLDGLGIRPGVELEVISTGARLDLRIAARPVTIQRAVAAKVWTRVVNPS